MENNNKIKNVLSLFDGISCGQYALRQSDIKYGAYYASEIDKHAITIANKNFPDTIQLGDIKNWRGWDINWEDIDLIMGGSPCQGFSIAGNKLDFDDPRSKLFFIYSDILEHVRKKNPEVKFLLENVRMNKESRDVITSYMGVEPIEINSSLVSAQNRKRLYWTNIGNIEQPIDKGIELRDILLKGNQQGEEWLNKYKIPYEKTIQILNLEAGEGKIDQICSGYLIHWQVVNPNINTGEYLFGCITPDRIYKRQNGQRFNNGKKFYTLTTQDRHGVITEGYIRKLSPIEWERLQNLPDDYTLGISESQRYKALGNGWTIGIINHILENLKEV